MTDHEWRKDANCAGLNPDLFFPTRGEETAHVKTLCEGCPSRVPCLEWAVLHEPYGVWGGTSGRQRDRIRKQRGMPGYARGLMLDTRNATRRGAA